MYKNIVDFNNEISKIMPENPISWKQGALFLMDVIFTTFAGKYQNTTNFIPFNRIQADFLKHLYMNDELYFYYNQTKNECLIYTKIKDNEYNDILNKKIINIPNDELIKVKWDNNNYRFLMWRKLSEDISQLETIYKINSITDMKKFLLSTENNSNELIEQMKEDYMSLDPFIIQRGGNELIQDGQLSFPADITDISQTSTKSQIAMNNIQSWWNWRANLLGWTTAQEQKLERKTFAEGQIDIANTIYLDRITQNNLKIFAYDCKQKWNIDINFKETIDLTPQTLQSNQPNQEKEITNNDL